MILLLQIAKKASNSSAWILHQFRCIQTTIDYNDNIINAEHVILIKFNL